MRRRWAALRAIAALALAIGVPAVARAQRPVPNTSGAIHVWEDQLPDSMSTAQVRFIARHIDGTQKVSLLTARRLRASNPRFLVLHYRLGIGDGPVPFRIGARWASDFATVTKHQSWFWHQGGRRVLQTQYDWYLMNPDSGWSAYWARRVLYEARLLGDDGVFADSLSVPQYLGPDSFSPTLQYFVGEHAWMARIDRFMRHQRRLLRGRLWFIPNAGSWITTRDHTDYSLPDGVMIEGFAEADASNFYAVGDWQLQMDRILGLVRLGRIILAQSYLNASDVTARGFALGSYLLVKGSHTFLNLDVGLEAQWFPEYGIDLGSALGSPPRSIDQLRQPNGLYERRFQRGFVTVNPGARALSLRLAAPALLVRPFGGGALPSDANVSGWGLREVPVSGSVTVPAHGAVVLMASS
ncbi:MAG: putative glycoside hydrolase [Actinomycetota bacterium]|nr:putative glycoside hydrolase [Actinomycetota bacterium]